MSTLATAWILIRRDGGRLGFTEHDGVLRVDGVECLPRSGFTPTTTETQLGFAHDNAEVAGVLDDSRLHHADLAGGLYDGATLETWQVDWTRGAAELRRTHRIRAVRHTSDRRFSAELEGLGAALGTVRGRVVSRLCGARFADGRCGLDAGDFPEGTTCPRTFAACRGFGNVANFRGFPHLIGDDALVQGVSDALPVDGGSRYRNNPNV